MSMAICMLYFEYCPVGDHFGFQVGFLKQYVVCFCGCVCAYVLWRVGSDRCIGIVFRYIFDWDMVLWCIDVLMEICRCIFR